MTWWDVRHDHPSSSRRKQETSLMEERGLPREEQQRRRAVDRASLPAGVLSPISKELAATCANMDPTLSVDVSVRFTDPVIRSEYHQSYSSSWKFTPTDEIYNGLLCHIEDHCRGLVTRKDSRALDNCHEVTLAPKRQRYEITFRILKTGSLWREMTFRSYQKQPLTVNFTKQVVAATHRTVEAFFDSHDRGFQEMDGRDDPGLVKTVPSPDEPLSPCKTPLSRFAEVLQSPMALPGYTISLSFRSRTPRPARALYEKKLKIDSGQSEHLSLSLAEHLFWDISESVRSSLAAKKQAVDEEGVHRNSLDGLNVCPYLNDDSVHVELRITDNIGPGYNHLHKVFRNKRSLFRDTNLTDALAFVKSLESEMKHARDLADDEISLSSDSKLRGLELNAPAGSVREPLEASDSDLRPTVETVMAFTNSVTSDRETGGGTPEGRRLSKFETSLIGGLTGGAVKSEAPDTTPQRRWFLLVNRSTPTVQSSDDNEDDTLRYGTHAGTSGHHSTENSNSVQTTSAEDSFTSEKDAASRPRVFALAPGRYAPASRRHTMSTLASHLPEIQPAPVAYISVEENEPHEAVVLEEPLEAVEDIPLDVPRAGSKGEPEHILLSTVLPVDVAQHPNPSGEEADGITTLKLELGPPIDLPENSLVLKERSNTSPGHCDSGPSVTEDLGWSISVRPLRDNDSPTSNCDDSERSRVDLMGTSSIINTENNAVAHAETGEEDDLPAESDDQDNATAPSTPGLSSGSDASPRHSILMTPIMMRTRALVNDDIMDVSALDYDKTKDHVHDNASLEIHAVELAHHREASFIAEEIQFTDRQDDPLEIKQHAAQNESNADLDVSASDMANQHQPLPNVGSDDVSQSTIEDDKEAYSYLYDAELEVAEASMIELPSSPTLGAMQTAWWYDEDADLSGMDESSFDMGYSWAAEAAESEHSDHGAVVDVSSTLTSFHSDPAEIELPPSPEVQLEEAEVDVFDEVWDTSDEGIMSYSEASQSVDIYEVRSTQTSALTYATVDEQVDHENEPALEVGPRTVEQDFHLENAEAQVDKTDPVESCEPRMVELPPSPKVQASESEDIATNERSEVPAVDRMDWFTRIQTTRDNIGSDGEGALPEPPLSFSSPSLGNTLVDVEEEDGAEADVYLEDQVELEMYFFTDRNTVEELAAGIPANSVSETVVAGPMAVQLPLSQQMHADDAGRVVEEIAKEDGLGALEVEGESLIEVSLSAAETTPELLELDNDDCTPDDHQEEQTYSAKLGNDAVERHTTSHARSGSADLPSLFAPAVADWLVRPDPIPAHAPGSVEHPHPYDIETATTAVIEAEQVEIPTEHQEGEESTQAPASTSPYLAAREISNPFDQLSSKFGSVSIGEQDENLYHQPSEQDNTQPRTPRRVTFLIRTPFSLRTSSAFSPAPPSPVLSFSSRSSSFSSLDRPTSISLARDSVDTIDPLPQESQPRDSVDTIAPLPEDEPLQEKDYRPSTAGWLGFHEAKPNRRFSMPLQHVWGSDRGGSNNGSIGRPGTPTSNATVRHYYRKHVKRPSLASPERPRPMASGALETVRVKDEEDASHETKGVGKKFVMLFAGMNFASRNLSGDDA